MTAIPARIAGVREVVLASPPAVDGLPAPAVLVAADIAGVDRVFRVGGAQAIAAMAYGTKTIPMVDVVCGPGSIYVTLAKRLVYGDVGIDGLFGPTETVVIADGQANPTLCAADLVAQAEHDVLARPVLITTSSSLAEIVEREVTIRVKRLDRAAIATRAVEEQGCIVVVDNLDQAFALGNEFAPEHMCLMLENPWSYASQVKNAGAVFLGDYSYEVLGDYVAGPSHVMPTGGTARFGSGLGVRAFLKFTPIVGLDDATSAEVSKAAVIIARAEGLTGHAEAAEIRKELERE
jgi:histidinol dehydrogenase